MNSNGEKTKGLSGNVNNGLIEGYLEEFPYGWTLKRISSSHHIFGRDDLPRKIIVVSVHGNRALKKGTQRGII